MILIEMITDLVWLLKWIPQFYSQPFIEEHEDDDPLLWEGDQA